MWKWRLGRFRKGISGRAEAFTHSGCPCLPSPHIRKHHTCMYTQPPTLVTWGWTAGPKHGFLSHLSQVPFFPSLASGGATQWWGRVCLPSLLLLWRIHTHSSRPTICLVWKNNPNCHCLFSGIPTNILRGIILAKATSVFIPRFRKKWIQINFDQTKLFLSILKIPHVCSFHINYLVDSQTDLGRDGMGFEFQCFC